MTVILGGFADEISPDSRAKFLVALIGGARSRSDQPTALPVKLVVRASTTPLIGNTIAPSPGAGKVPGPAGVR
jgi:hypothetical protein